MRNHTVISDYFCFCPSPRKVERVWTQRANNSIRFQEKPPIYSELWTEVRSLEWKLGNPNKRELERQKATGQSFKIYVGFEILKSGITKASFTLYERKSPGDVTSKIMWPLSLLPLIFFICQCHPLSPTFWSPRSRGGGDEKWRQGSTGDSKMTTSLDTDVPCSGCPASTLP